MSTVSNYPLSINSVICSKLQLKNFSIVDNDDEELNRFLNSPIV